MGLALTCQNTIFSFLMKRRKVVYSPIKMSSLMLILLWHSDLDKWWALLILTYFLYVPHITRVNISDHRTCDPCSEPQLPDSQLMTQTMTLALISPAWPHADVASHDVTVVAEQCQGEIPIKVEIWEWSKWNIINHSKSNPQAHCKLIKMFSEQSI